MCGIAGIVGERDDTWIDQNAIHRMCQTLVHRGPDDEGCFVKNGAGLGMRRLSIIDLAGGHQPVFNEDRSVWLVFNGEIYNFRELRRELEGRGHHFQTHTDTEVIVHLYEDYGADCVHKLRGMFAFALFDEGKRRLLMARDRLGEKPLHYALAGGRLLFGSEIKAILAVAPELAALILKHCCNIFILDISPILPRLSSASTSFPRDISSNSREEKFWFANIGIFPSTGRTRHGVRRTAWRNLRCGLTRRCVSS